MILQKIQIIKIEKNPYNINFELKYKKITVYYNICYYVDKEIPEFHTLSFALEKLYLNDKIYIKVGEEAKKVISKLKKYLEETLNNIKEENLIYPK